MLAGVKIASYLVHGIVMSFYESLHIVPDICRSTIVERFDKAVCYTDNMQFIFPKDLRVCVYTSCFDMVVFGARIEHENAF